MQKIKSLVILAMVVATSATLCCKTESLGLDVRTNLPEKASDSKATKPSRPMNIPSVLRMKETKTSVLKAQDDPPFILKSAHQAQEAYASTSNTKPQISTVPTQVLVLNVKDKKNQRLIIERKVGGALDWKFVSVQGSEIKDVWAHKSIVIKYSSKMRKMVEVLANGGIQRNYFLLTYSVPIIESLLTLMYEHNVTIKKSEYAKIMEAAKELEMDGLIEAL